MSQVVIPDEALIREPGLLVPGRKPVGPVRVDWSHPLARGLTHAWGFWDGQPFEARISGLQFRDIAGAANGVFGTGNGGVSGNRWRVTDEGPAIYSDDAGTGTHSSVIMNVGNANGSGSPTGRPDTGNLPFSVVASEKGARFDTRYYYRCGDLSFRGKTGNLIELIESGVADIVGSTTALDTSKRNVVGCSYDTTYVSLFINGQFDNGTSYTANWNWDAQAALNDQNDGAILYFVYVFNRALSAAEHAAIARDPYQFLRPA